MAESIDAGALDQRLELLELVETSPGVFEWTTTCRTWGRVTTGKNAVFSPHAASAPGVEAVIRRRALDLHHALRWRDCTGTLWHLAPASITPMDRMHLAVQAAMVRPCTCLATRTEDTVGPAGRPTKAETMRVQFPGILSQKYARYEREETHDTGQIRYVLVTPKAISLQAGDLVTVEGGLGQGLYHVTVVHSLDPWRGEVEIDRAEDV